MSRVCKDSAANPAGIYTCCACKHIYNSKKAIKNHLKQFPDHKIDPLTELLSQTTIMAIAFCKFVDKDQVII